VLGETPKKMTGKQLLGLVKDLQGSERLYGGDLSAVPAMEAKLRALAKRGKTTFRLGPLWRGR